MPGPGPPREDVPAALRTRADRQREIGQDAHWALAEIGDQRIGEAGES
ncbi:hypothetical protein AB0L59_20795 [Streptomyces sp. NPDC052109]